MTKTFYLLLSLLFLLISTPSISNTIPSTKHADSLFLMGKKKVALEEYKTIIKTQNVSNQTLVKAIIIAEQTQNVPFQLLCLNKFYKNTNSNTVQEKIELICEEKGISGHTFSDIHWLAMWYTLYKSSAILICVCVILTLCCYYTFLIIKKKTSVAGLLSPLIVLLFILLILNNVSPTFEKGVVFQHTSIKKNDSGISPEVYKLKAGDAVYIHEKNKTWTKVTIEDNTGYIRTNTLIKI